MSQTTQICKKRKKNGKWRYYYDVGTTGAIVNGSKMSNIKGYSKIQDILGYDERDAYNISRLNANAANENADKVAKLRTNPTESHLYDAEVHKELVNKGKKHEAEVAKNWNSYSKTPLGMIDRIDDKIDVGREKLSELLTRISERIKPKKEELHRHYNRKY